MPSHCGAVSRGVPATRCTRYSLPAGSTVAISVKFLFGLFAAKLVDVFQPGLRQLFYQHRNAPQEQINELDL